jgi:hypothetical protein
MPEPLSSPEAYQAFIYSLTERFPAIRRSTLVYIPSGELFGRAEGMHEIVVKHYEIQGIVIAAVSCMRISTTPSRIHS